MELYRRDLLTGAAAIGATAALPAFAAGSAETRARAVLAATTEVLLADYPENPSALGIDTGKRAGLKSKLTDRSAAADHRRASEAAARLARLRAVDRKGLSPQTALDLDVTQAAHELAMDGWKRMPVGDVATLNGNVSYRSTPYIVSQGTGSFAETPSLIEDKHGVANTADADAYLTRLEAYAASLDDETARIRADAGKGVLLPGFLNDITRRQLTAGATQPVGEWSIVTSFGDKVAKAGLSGDWRARAAALCEKRVAPALMRQAAAFGTLRPARAHRRGGLGAEEWRCLLRLARRSRNDHHNTPRRDPQIWPRAVRRTRRTDGAVARRTGTDAGQRRRAARGVGQASRSVMAEHRRGPRRAAPISERGGR